MLCPYCGAETKEGEVFCVSCGYDITSVPADTKEEKAAPPKNNTRATPAKRRRKNMHNEHSRLVILAAVGLIALVAGISLLISALLPGNGFYAFEHNIFVEIIDRQVSVLMDDRTAKDTNLSAGTIKEHQASLDGGVVAILTDRKELAVIRGRKLTVVASNVSDFSLSVDGTGLAYTTESKKATTLTLYNTKNKKAKEITAQLIGNYEISPDGDSIAYFTKEETGEHSLMLFNGSKRILIAAVDVSLTGMPKVSLLAISNDGKYIYAIDKNEEGVKTLYCYGKTGVRKPIGPCNIPTVLLNADHTQILFYQSDDSFRTYLATKDNAGIEIATGVASPLLPKSSVNFVSGSTVTFPSDSLYNKVYSCYVDGGYQLCHIRKDCTSILLVSGVGSITLSEDGKTVYYVEDDVLKMLKISNGENASEKAVVLGENVDEYAVTSDGKNVYYTSDNALYCVNGKNGQSKKTVASENVKGKLHINAKNYVYFKVENDVYVSKNGSNGTIILSNIDSIQSSANGIVYVSLNNDSLYATSGTKKLHLVWPED